MNLLFTSWQDAWQLAGWTMILFLAAGTGWLIVAGAMRLILRRANANLRYGASLVSFVMLSVLPMIIAGTLMESRGRPEELTAKLTEVTTEYLLAEFPIMNPEHQRRELAATFLAKEVTESTEKTDEIAIAAIPNAPFDFEGLLYQGIDYLPWVWIVGTPLTFALLASGLIGAERLRRSCKLLADGPIYVACEELRTALKITRKVGVAICESISSPLMVGIVKPLILLPPAALSGWSPEHLEMVLVHELAHVRRWDNGVNLFQRVVESLLFFHPAVWIVSGWVRRDREDCCDAVVVRHTARPQAYAELLLALASHQPLAGLATSAAMARHPLASRIRRILKLQDEPMLVWRHALGFLASAVLACVLAVGLFRTSDAEESVSREAERSAVERASDGRFEKATDQTNRFSTDQDLATEDPESTEEEYVLRSEKLSDGKIKYSFVISGVKIWDDAVRRATEKALIKSPLILNRAIDELDISLPLVQNARPSLKDWLFREIGVEYSPDGTVLITFVSKEEDKPQVEKIVKPVVDAYREERRRQASHNDLATEDAEKKREDTDDYTIVYNLDKADEVFAELLQKFKGGDKFTMTGDDKQITVTAKQMMHDKVINFFADKGLNYKATAKNSLFPTLEDQRAADLAYKLLGVELEKLTPEELERVKAKGYQGGLRAIDEGGLRVGGRPLNNGDLLVGLHVWPTESFTDVTEILSRDDLDQLSPMKFYVLRQTRPSDPADTWPDRVVTGRIEVDLDAWRTLQNQRRKPQLQQMIALQKEVQEDLAQKEKIRDTGNVKNRDMLDAEIAQLREILEKLNGQVARMTSPVSDERLAIARQPSILELKREIAGMVHQRHQLESVEGTNDALGRLDASIVEARSLLKQFEGEQSLEARRAAKQYEFAKKKYEHALESNRKVQGSVSRSEIDELKLAAELAELEVERGTSQIVPPDEEVLFFPVDPAKSNLPASQKLAYDGKGFDEWRRMWRAELKTEKRTECIKALAAFGRAGLGQEAAEAILDVAGEYEFDGSVGPEVNELQVAIQNVLILSDGIPAEYWLPLLVERLKQDPDKWDSMAHWVLRGARSKNPEVLKILITMAGDKQFHSPLRRIAVENIVTQLDSGNKDAENVVHEALQSTDPMLALSALHQLSFKRLDQFPEQLDLLFSEDKNIRRQSHRWIDRLLDEPEAAWAIEKLLAIADDPARGEDRGIALYALAMIAKQGDGRQYIRLREQVWEKITAILQTGEVELIPYALHSGARLKGSNINYVIIQLGKSVNEERVQQIDQAREKAEDLRMYFDGNEGGGPFD
jgi:beta-lactamase regulating signal transducer with metallopeptidase domain